LFSFFEFSQKRSIKTGCNHHHRKHKAEHHRKKVNKAIKPAKNCEITEKIELNLKLFFTAEMDDDSDNSDGEQASQQYITEQQWRDRNAQRQNEQHEMIFPEVSLIRTEKEENSESFQF
jgi:hypothetical protein